MNKFFSFLWEKIKEVFKFAKSQTFLVFYLVFTWVIPIYLLNDTFPLFKDRVAGRVLSFVGILVLVFVIAKFYKKLISKLYNFSPRRVMSLVVQLLLIFLHRIIIFGGVSAILYFATIYIDKVADWWWSALISIAIGILFYILDKIVQFVRAKKKRLLEKEKLKEEIKEEILNGE